MMTFKLLTFLFITFLAFKEQSILANTIKLEGHRSLKNCSSHNKGRYYYCKNNKGEKFFVKSSGWTYLAFKKNRSGELKQLEVHDIENEQDESIFSLRQQMKKDSSSKPTRLYTGAIEEFKEELGIHTNFLNYDLGVNLTKEDGEIYKELSLIKDKIEKKRTRLEKSIKDKKLKAKLANGKEIHCTRDKKKSCPILTCKEDDSDITRLLIRQRTSNNSNFDSFSLRNNQLQAKSSTITQIRDTKDNLLIKQLPSPPQGEFTSAMLVPSNYRNSPEFFNRMISPRYNAYLQKITNSCSKDQKKLLNNTFKKVKEDHQNAKMIQYIAFANGAIQSFYINPESLPENSCYHKGAYYSQQGFKQTVNMSPITKKTISLKKAQELFDKARARKDIAWDYTYDGCYARAHLMAQMFEKEGIHVDKAWLRGDLKIPGDQRGRAWGYHVAPVLYVEDERGEIKPMIIDPSISKTPLSPKKWAALMEVDYNDVDEVPYPTPNNTSFYNKASYSVSNSSVYWPSYYKDLDSDEKLKMATQTMYEYGAQPSSSQTKWELWQ